MQQIKQIVEDYSDPIKTIEPKTFEKILPRKYFESYTNHLEELYKCGLKTKPIEKE